MVWKNDGLTDTERAMLWVESRETFRTHGLKMQHAYRVTGLNEVQYYAELDALIQRPEAQKYDPITCRRLLDLKEARRAVRSQSRLHAIESQ